MASDAAGNTFTPIGALTLNSSGLRAAQHFYAKNTIANASDAVTCTPNVSEPYISTNAIQYAGADTSAPLDQHTELTVPVSGNSCPSSTFTTTAANELLAEACVVAGTSRVFTAGPGYAVELTDAGDSVGLEDEIVSAIQTTASSTETFTGGASNPITLTASFKAAVASGGTSWSYGTNATGNASGLAQGVTAGTSPSRLATESSADRRRSRLPFRQLPP